MATLQAFAKDFFVSHCSLLREHYPGISYRKLIQELDDLGEDLKSSYLPQKNRFFDSLLKGIPLEHIGNKCYFFRSCLEMRERVFIPRPETEILVEEAVKELNSQYGETFTKPVKILDVGTGSGNIILSIAQEYPGAIDATGVDISEEALALAERNAFRLQYTFSKNKTFRFIKSDRLAQISPPFHLIVSNPPYIKRNQDSAHVHPQVARWDPPQALYLEDETYNDWFKDFFTQVQSALVKGGAFFMEGHENHLADLQEIAENIGGFASITIKDDLTARNRFLIMRT